MTATLLIRLVVLAMIAGALAACHGGQVVVGAAPLCVDDARYPADRGDTCALSADDRKLQTDRENLEKEENNQLFAAKLSVYHADLENQIFNIVQESEYKCGQFVDELTKGEGTSNTVLDILGGGFAALGTAFTPLSTVHALSAASAISSGAKGAINGDLLAKAAISDFADAIQKTYYVRMDQFVRDVAATDPAKLSYGASVARIRIIHRYCSLASAEATISATLSGSGGNVAAAPGAATQQVVQVLNKPADGDDFKIIGSIAKPSKTLTAEVNQKGLNTIADVVLLLVVKVNADSDFQALGIFATPGNDAASVVLHIPAGIAACWSATSGGTPDKLKTDECAQVPAPAGAGAGGPPAAAAKAVLAPLFKLDNAVLRPIPPPGSAAPSQQ